MKYQISSNCIKGHGTAIFESSLLLEGENEKSMAMKYYCQYRNEISTFDFLG